jgi:hypothetical protein
MRSKIALWIRSALLVLVTAGPLSAALLSVKCFHDATTPPPADASFIEEASAINVKFCAELDAEYARTGDASETYQRLKASRKEELRRTYLKHGKTPPP